MKEKGGIFTALFLCPQNDAEPMNHCVVIDNWY